MLPDLRMVTMFKKAVDQILFSGGDVDEVEVHTSFLATRRRFAFCVVAMINECLVVTDLVELQDNDIFPESALLLHLMFGEWLEMIPAWVHEDEVLAVGTR